MLSIDIQWHRRVGSEYTYEELYQAFVQRYEEEKRLQVESTAEMQERLDRMPLELVTRTRQTGYEPDCSDCPTPKECKAANRCAMMLGGGRR